MSHKMVENFKNVFKLFCDRDKKLVESRYFLEFLNEYVKLYKFEFPIHHDILVK